MGWTKGNIKYFILGVSILAVVAGAPVLAAIIEGALTLDPTFGQDGQVRATFFEGAWDHVDKIAIQKDGKILMVGRARTSAGCDGWDVGKFIARYEKNGSLDPSFGDGGKVLISEQSAGSLADISFIIEDILIQQDGKILTFGYHYFSDSGHSWSNDSGHNFVVRRYNGDGSVDKTFGLEGTAVTDIESQSADFANYFISFKF